MVNVKIESEKTFDLQGRMALCFVFDEDTPDVSAVMIGEGKPSEDLPKLGRALADVVSDLDLDLFEEYIVSAGILKNFKKGMTSHDDSLEVQVIRKKIE